MALQRPSPRALNRILLNVLLDGALAAVAAPLARYLADADGGLLHPLWFVAGGAITLLLAGLPFRMPQQYWRFAGIEDLLAVVGGSVASRGAVRAAAAVSGFPLPSATFPVIHAPTLIVLLGTPRVIYRLRRGRVRTGAAAQPVLLVGAGENADVFLRAVDTREGQSFRVLGLLSAGAGQCRAADPWAVDPGVGGAGGGGAGPVAAGGAAGGGAGADRAGTGRAARWPSWWRRRRRRA